jgi:mono/diheme cytochrome c family protein
MLAAVAACPWIWFNAGCAGPQPLRQAIRPADLSGYSAALNASNGDARLAFARWMAPQRGITPERLLQDDAGLSTTRNPFDAHKDSEAISRGAVMYQLHCARCHGDDAAGRGASTLPDYPTTSFKTFGKRLAATLHRGAPRKWFRVIRDGSGEEVDYPEGRMSAMPALEDKLTREQAWLTITYLQSLDVHAAGADEAR